MQLPNGSWMSEKNPGYPFFAAPFQLLGLLRFAPLFYGALGCLGLYVGGRRWLGRWGGMSSVALFCGSGAALVFAWRATMPTFTDASLVAAGTGALIWAMLATDATTPRRTLVGLLAFLALEAAVSIRYTNVVVLAVALAAVAIGRRAARLPLHSLGWWLGSVAVLAGALAVFNLYYYGGVLKTGYSSGVITFGLSAVRPNLEDMPYHLVRAMPLLVLGLAASGWIGIRAARSLRGGPDASRTSVLRRDAAVGAALTACWVGIFGLYSAYTWTVGQAGTHDLTVHVVRFYVPALGAVALLAAWFLTRLPPVVSLAGLATLAVLAVITFPGLAGSGMGGPGGPGIPAGGAPSSGQMQGGPPAGAPRLPNGQVPTGSPPNDAAPAGGNQQPSTSS